MADLLFDLLSSQPIDGAPPASPAPGAPAGAKPRPVADPASLQYLAALAAQPLAALDASESQALAHESHSLLPSMQALANKSHKSIIQSASHHAALHTHLPALARSAADLRAAIPRLD